MAHTTNEVAVSSRNASLSFSQYSHMTTKTRATCRCADGETGINDGYASTIQQGDVFVAGRNFGCGSSREHAPISIKAAGVKCVIAKSFARIFFRNAINVGLPVLESVEAVKSIREGDMISVDFKKGVIINYTEKESYSFMAFSENLIEIISAGGLVNFVNNQRDD
jgi:3-isopropylmalate/(R)-2-methylmalate dehydratase small subunit